MISLKKTFSTIATLVVCNLTIAQEASSPYTWTVTAKRIAPATYELQLATAGSAQYWLYSPNQTFDDYTTAAIGFSDSSISFEPMRDSGRLTTWKNPLFDNRLTKGYEGSTVWKTTIRFSETAPQSLTGTFNYTYGNEKELYPAATNFNVALEGGLATKTRIHIASIDISNPANPCGDASEKDKSWLTIFLLGIGGGLLALLTPCVFPLIPLTVSFFTKSSGTRRQALVTAALYAGAIVAIYLLLSLPFHFLDHLAPEVLNTIATNAWLNLAFFVIFLCFAFSFFGYYEIALPAALTNRIAPGGGVSFWGVLFMALTLAVVSFSCTGPILGSLLAGAVTSNGGAWALMWGMTGFGLGLALPFFLFALFPQALKSLPKSGGWLTQVKVFLGFLELALALKFFSNADLVNQWGILKREVFIGGWIVIALCAMAYLIGLIRFPHTSKQKLTKGRWALILILAAFIAYLSPGLFNTTRANLSAISGFPPPVCYSIYKNPVACADRVQPLHDYEEALAEARREGKPLLIDFTGWACVNCRRMEEAVWTDPEVRSLMMDSFVVVSLYVDERKRLPLKEQGIYTTKGGTKKNLKTIGDKWATFQSENFGSVQQPQYAILNFEEKLLTGTKSYTKDTSEFRQWLLCGLNIKR